jgi:hypothetical protein
MQTDDILKPEDNEEAFLAIAEGEEDVVDVDVDVEDVPTSDVENSLAMLHQGENPEDAEVYEFFVDDEDELDNWN